MRTDIVSLELACLCTSAGLVLLGLIARKQKKINEAVQEQITGLVDVLRTLVLTYDDKSLEQALRRQGAARENK